MANNITTTKKKKTKNTRRNKSNSIHGECKMQIILKLKMQWLFR